MPFSQNEYINSGGVITHFCRSGYPVCLESRVERKMGEERGAGRGEERGEARSR